MIYIFLLFFLFFGIISFLIFNRIYIKTSTMAVVMAIGIVTEGALLNFFGIHFFKGIFGKLLCTFNLSLWASFLFSLFMTYFNGEFKIIHYTNPINRFGIGTWIAGTSICGIIFYKQFPQSVLVSEIITYLDACLWIIYMGICLKALYVISRSSLKENAHGILLLTTVSTQSIVLLSNTVFIEVPSILNQCLLILGFCFYMVSAFYIIKRYIKSSWSIELDWNNTNCILHGAISISGIACMTTKVLNESSIHFIWTLALIVFFIVECIEISRFFKRIKKEGVKKGILIYDVTQWSRIFTFAMFYTFTSLIHFHESMLGVVRSLILSAGIWFIIALLIMEVILSLVFVLNTYTKSIIGKQKENGVSLPS